MKVTNCTCLQPGWCERHRCHKTPLLYRLCQEQTSSFDDWERGAGIRIEVSDSQGHNVPSGPGMLQRAANFGRALVHHAQSGFQTVDEQEVARRLTICRHCEYCDVGALICRHVECGCYLTIKARWAVATCPLSKWTPTEPISQE